MHGFDPRSADRQALHPHGYNHRLHTGDAQGPPGKLKAVGRAWATGRLDGSARTDEAATDAKLWGIELPDIDLDSADVIWAQHLDAVAAFMAIQTQWQRVATMNGLIITGLDYAGAEAGLRLAGVEVTADIWADVRQIEAGAVAAMLEDAR